MNTQGFYRKNGNSIDFGEDMISGDGYLLLKDEKDSYDYPIDGWIWVESLEDAIQQFATNDTEQIGTFLVQPENFELSLKNSDRIAFTQMLALVREALDLGFIDDSTPQIIADSVGTKHTISTLRFRQIMVEYGLYYKSIWDSK